MINVFIIIITFKVTRVNQQTANAVEDIKATPQGLCAHTMNPLHTFQGNPGPAKGRYMYGRSQVVNGHICNTCRLLMTPRLTWAP